MTSLSGSTAPSPATTTRGRLHWVDTTRIALIVLVLAHHCAVTYGNIPLWFYTEPATDASGGALDLLVIINQQFFMGLFFFISGYFAPGSVDRKGAARFARDRLVRLGLPLLAFLLLLRPLASLPAWWQMPDRPDYGTFYVISWDPGPTWFLEVLLVFSLVYAAAAALWRRAGRSSARATSAAPLRGPAVLGGLLALTAIMLVIIIGWRQLVPDGSYWPIIGLPTPSFLPQYALLFAAGILTARRDWLTRLPGWTGWFGLVLTVIGGLAGVVLTSGGDPVLTSVGSGVLASAGGVGLSLAVLMLIRRVAPGTGPVRRYASANAFAVYVIHPVILVWLAVALAGLVAPAAVKFAVLLVLAVPACWLIAGLIRRIPVARRVL